MTSPIVRVRNVSKSFFRDGFEIVALDNVSLDIHEGDFFALMGPSGSGKSTLLNLLAGIDLTTDGEVEVLGTNLAGLSESQLAVWRNAHIGYIFQTFNLITVRTALENVTLPMLFAGVAPDEADEKGMQLLDTVGLGHRYHHRPSELSGGQQQRVAIARSLANSPSIVLADEPTGNLDLKTGQEIIDLLRQLNDEQGVTIISATHDHKMLDVSDRIFHIRDGQLASIDEKALA